MTLFYRLPDAITNVLPNCAAVAGDYVDIDYDDQTPTGIWLDGNSTTDVGGLSCTFANMSSFGPVINSITVDCQMNVSSGNRCQFGLTVSGTDYLDYTATGAGVDTYYTKVFSTNPYTGVAWKLSELPALKAKFYDPREALGLDRLWRARLIVDASPPNPTATNAARTIASARVFGERRPRKVGTLTGNLGLLNRSPFDLLEVEHIAGPHPEDEGWGSKVWQRRQMEIRSMTLGFMSGTVRAEVRDQRDMTRLVWFPAYSTKGSGAIEDGIARVHTPGSTWSFTRASDQTVTNPLGASETVTPDVPAYADGLVLLAASGSLAASYARITNDATARTVCAAQGTWECAVYLAAVSGSTNQVAMGCSVDASNYMALYWAGASSQWRFVMRLGGVDTFATLAASPSPATWYRLAARWIGTESELGLAPYTLSVFLDGTKGTDATAGGVISFPATMTYGLEIGRLGTAVELNGRIRNISSYAYPRTDNELQRAL